jgi:zinc protease
VIGEKIDKESMAIQATAPEPLAPVAFHIPEAFETTLDNGLRVVIFEDSRLPLVSYRLAFFSGDANDPAGRSGLTTSMASMMSEGTENYSSRDLAEKIERLGASLHVSSSDDFTIVSASGLTIYSADVLDLMTEVVLRPTFPEEELDLYRRNTLENLKFQRSQPGFLANEQTARILYGDHPYSTISPSPETVEGLTREELIKLHETRMIPNNAVFIAVGDVDRESFLKELRGHFDDWEQGEFPVLTPATPPSRTERTVTIVDRPGSAQSNIVISNLGVNRNHPDYFPLLVMNQVLGAGASSRVFMNLREEKGYTYGAYTRLDMKKLSGEFEATAEVRTAVTGDSLKEFFYELMRIRDEEVPEQELADAKAYLTGVFPIRAETQEGLASLIIGQQLYGLPSDYLQTYRDHVNAVTPGDVKRVARNHVRPDEAAIVVVGDAGEVLRQIRGYAESIEVFDTEKNPRELSQYATDDSAEPADLAGTWELTLDFQGQAVPVTMELAQNGANVNGKLATMLGDGQITDGRVSGNKFSATASTEMQGESLELSISGKLDGEGIEGTISAPIIPAPLTFTGLRKA